MPAYEVLEKLEAISAAFAGGEAQRAHSLLAEALEEARAENAKYEEWLERSISDWENNSSLYPMYDDVPF